MPLYNRFKYQQLGDTGVTPINLKTDTIKVALLTSSYTPDIDNHNFLSDVNANEVSGTGYTAGGATLANPSITKDTTNDRAYLDADDTTWANSTLTARYAVLYKSTGTAATSVLIGYIDFGANKSTVGDTFYIQWAAPGVGGVLSIA
jgi:hypothetical protein